MEDNWVSIAVTTTLGYRLIERHDITERGCTYAERVHQLDRDAWLGSPIRRRHHPTITGVECLVDLLDR